mmetsp:Transcript_29821/g.42542  ORF Transcript_29821/g.42542 Transcript_29821/m.42542 type:complete len:279 (+) Transcript_29821:41-877(+)
MVRVDLRKTLQTRPIKCEFGMVGVSEAEGSACYSQGKSKVIVTVQGPSQPKYSRHEEFDTATIDIDVSFSTILATATSQRLDTRDMDPSTTCSKKLSAFLRKSLLGCLCLRNYPRMLICLRVVVVCDQGSLYSVALNACVFALLDAGLLMTYTPNSVTFCVTRGLELYLDPSMEEEAVSIARMIFTINPKMSTIIASEFSYNFSNNDSVVDSMGNVTMSNNSVAVSQGDVFQKDFIANAIHNAFNASIAIDTHMRSELQSKLGFSDEIEVDSGHLSKK